MIYNRVIRRSNLKLIIILSLFFLLTNSCSIRKDFKLGEEALAKKDWDLAVRYFMDALDRDPDNVEYRISLSKALIAASNSHLKKGEGFLNKNEYKLAMIEFSKSLEFNPENNEARRKKLLTLRKIEEIKEKYLEKTKIEKMKAKAKKEKLSTPENLFSKKPLSLKLTKSKLESIFKALQKVCGVNFLYDEAYKTRRLAVKLDNVTLIEAVEKILYQTKLFYKIIDSNSILIIPDTPAKRRQYEELVMRTFFLSNSIPEEIQKIVQKLTGIKTIAVNKTLNSITIKGVPERIELAEKIIQTNDRPRGEILLEIEIIEVNKNRLKEYGIELSQYDVTETYMPGGVTDENTASAIPLNMLTHTDTSDYILSLPSINYKLLKRDSKSKIKARPRLRVMDQEQVEVRLGDKVPIPTTTFVPQYGTGVNNQPITSFQMQDVGINIDLTPRIHHDGQITLKMNFELTFITDPGSETIPPTIGNRSIKTVIKLRDNETTILAGLLRDIESKSVRGFPIVSEIPVLKDIFSGNKSEVDQTDIIITITPRIVRFPEIYEEDLSYYWAGTRDRPGLRKTPPTLSNDKQEISKKDSQKKEEIIKEEADLKSTLKTGSSKEAKRDEEYLKSSEYGVFLSFLVPTAKIEMNKEFPVSLSFKGKGEVKIIKIELEFDSQILQVKQVKKGTLFLDNKMKGHFFKTFDNQKGKVRLNFTFEGMERKDSGELAVINFSAIKTGKSNLKPVNFEAFDSKMNKVNCTFPQLEIKLVEPSAQSIRTKADK